MSLEAEFWAGLLEDKLRGADQCLSDGDTAQAVDFLLHYWQGRLRCGFQPTNVSGTGIGGDAFARSIQQRINSALWSVHLEG